MENYVTELKRLYELAITEKNISMALEMLKEIKYCTIPLEIGEVYGRRK